MNELEQAIIAALAEPEQSSLSNHAYFKFLKADLCLPCEPDSDPEDPRVLFLEENNQIFLAIFSEQSHFIHWAQELKDKIAYFQIKGFELIQGLGENVTLALNPGSESYKEFNPEEIKKLKTMVAKIQSLGH